jgi:hypothetical protein
MNVGQVVSNDLQLVATSVTIYVTKCLVADEKTEDANGLK